MYWFVLGKERLELLKKIVAHVDLEEFYLAGGTALALQLGLRESFDFDFFVPGPFNPHFLYEQLRAFAEDDISVLTMDNSSTCDLVINDIQISFLSYPYPVIADCVRCRDIEGLYLASIADIAAMKALAIGSRGAKKDFFDLYQILMLPAYNVDMLIESLYTKYGTNRDFSYVAMGMNYFEDADDEVLPKTYCEYDWQHIKRYFEALSPVFMNKLGKMQE